MAASGEGRRVRLAAGLSLREVAESIGGSPSGLWRWENGDRNPRGPAAAAWARLLSDLSKETAI